MIFRPKPDLNLERRGMDTSLKHDLGVFGSSGSRRVARRLSRNLWRSDLDDFGNIDFGVFLTWISDPRLDSLGVVWSRYQGSGDFSTII